MSVQAPPQWASSSRENGSSYLSWKSKTVLAATVILCGGGLAAQFPSTTASVEPSAAVALDSAQTDQPSLSQPQGRYASNAQQAEDEGGPTFAESGEQIGRYVGPPGIVQDGTSENPSSSSPSSSTRRMRMFDPIDESGLEKKALDLAMAPWNPIFDKLPPLKERLLQPLIDDSELVAVEPETVQAMRPAMEPEIGVVIDSSQLATAEETEKHQITIMIQEDSIVSAGQEPTPSEITPIISDDQLRPANME